MKKQKKKSPFFTIWFSVVIQSSDQIEKLNTKSEATFTSVSQFSKATVRSPIVCKVDISIGLLVW